MTITAGPEVFTGDDEQPERAEVVDEIIVEGEPEPDSADVSFGDEADESATAPQVGGRTFQDVFKEIVRLHRERVAREAREAKAEEGTRVARRTRGMGDRGLAN